MFELVRAQCPACGAKLKVDSRKDAVTCEYCGQRSMLHTRGTPPVTPPPPSPAVGAAPAPVRVIEIPNASRRIALALLIPVVMMVFISGLVYFIISKVNDTIQGALGGKTASGSFVSFGGGGGGGGGSSDDLPPLPPQGSYLQSPELIGPRVEQVADPPKVRYLLVGRQTMEVYPASGQRYSIHANGKALRRGGAIPVPETVVDLAQIDLSVLSSIIAQAARASGSDPTRAVLSAPDGTPQWSITVWSKTGGAQLRYSTDGAPLDE